MIFTNGRITCTGSKNDDDGYVAANYLLDKMKLDTSIFENEEDVLEAKIVNYDIVMINSNFSIGFMIDNHKLYDILISKRGSYHLFSSFDPRTYQGVKIYFMWNMNQLIKNGVCACLTKKCKISAKKKNGNGEGDCRRISVAVFGTGKILIAGAKNNTQLYDTYNFIIKLLQENYEEISQYNMEDKRRIIRICSVLKTKSSGLKR
jgi:TATA-box binding protein (TBP) (component of TFIID and TFIIIB)